MDLAPVPGLVLDLDMDQDLDLDLDLDSNMGLYPKKEMTGTLTRSVKRISFASKVKQESSGLTGSWMKILDLANQ